ncbi:MAG: UDP-N-acetylglucosamine 2-epimerase [Ignavibacteriales bacterium]
MLKRRKICVVTTSRADYGLLYWLMKEIQNDEKLELQIIVSGMHLSPEFGLTYKLIEKDGFYINKKIHMLLSSDEDKAAIKAIGAGCFGYSDALEDLNPEILVLLGDRFELLSAAVSALLLKIPIAHIHGGETSQGAVDEAIRHSITKMSFMHFPATEEYRWRILQMGENPGNVFCFGAPGLDHIYKTNLLGRKELSEFLNFDLSGKVALATYHPVTLENNTAAEQIANILAVLEQTDLKVIFTKSNADSAGRLINQMIQEFCLANPSKYKFFDNLGQVGYLSCLKNLDLVIGNSSSGLTEAPSFRIPVINIGDRQKGRTKAENILDSENTVESIVKSIHYAFSATFLNKCKNTINPYGKYDDGNISQRIKETLKNITITGESLKKVFNDFPLSAN